MINSNNPYVSNIKNVVLLGKGSLSIKVGNYLIEKFNLVLIVPDKPEPTWTDSLQNWSISNKIPYLDSGDFNHIDDKLREIGYKPDDIDLYISIFYGKIISKEFISSHNVILNLHNAPLPKYRGVNPINWALKNNETMHGVTIHKISQGIDDGPILGKILYPIYPEIEEVEDVYNKSLDYGWLLFKDVFGKIEYTLDNSYDQSTDFSYYSNKDKDKLQERLNFRR
jgi:methionyl-tRNA formyltransferase